MDGTAFGRNRVAVLEVLRVGWTAVDRLELGDAAHLLRPQTVRNRELLGGQGLGCALHEVGPYGNGDARGVRVLPDGRWLVEPNPHADDDRREEPDEPGI